MVFRIGYCFLLCWVTAYSLPFCISPWGRHSETSSGISTSTSKKPFSQINCRTISRSVLTDSMKAAITIRPVSTSACWPRPRGGCVPFDWSRSPVFRCLETPFSMLRVYCSCPGGICHDELSTWSGEEAIGHVDNYVLCPMSYVLCRLGGQVIW